MIESSSALLRCAILVFAALAVVEALAVIVGHPLPPEPFALAFYINLSLRYFCADHSDAKLWSPLAATLFATCTVERLASNLALGRKIVSRVKGGVTMAIVGTAFHEYTHHTARAVRATKFSLRLLRWLKWALPLFQMSMRTKAHVVRFVAMRRQRARRLLHDRLRAAMQKTRVEAARDIQARFRGRSARRHFASYRADARALATQAGCTLLRAAHRRREQRQRQLDARPLLLRPDSAFLSNWKLLALVLVVIDMAAVLLAPEGTRGKKLTSERARPPDPRCHHL